MYDLIIRISDNLRIIFRFIKLKNFKNYIKTNLVNSFI